MTTEELLNEMEWEAELHSEETPVCVIDPETRTITVPPEYQLLGVESDEKVERLYFQCPKIVGDNVDLSQLILFINYRNAGQEIDAYKITDVETDGDNITFSWLLDRKVTAYKTTQQNKLGFSFCAQKADEDGTLTQEWNTTINTECSVLEGLEAQEHIEEENSAVIAQIWQAIDELKAGGGGGGTPGQDGVGIDRIEKTNTQGLVDTYTIYLTDESTYTLTVTNGAKGDTGATPNIQIGTVQTLDPGQQATASMSGTPENPLLNLGIPKGGGSVDPEQIKQAVNGYLEENPPSGMTAEEKEQLDKNTEDISSLSTDTSKLENAVFGESLELPGVIDKADYILSGNPILLYKGDSLLSPDMFVNNGSAVYDAYTGLLSNAGNLSFAIAQHVPIDRTKTYYFRGIGSNACVIYGTNNVSSALGTILLQINSGGSVSASTLDRYEYYNLLFKTTITSGNAVMYFGESPEKNTVVSSEYNIKSTDYVGYYMLNSENASAKTESISDGITPTMPSAKSSLLVNKDLKLTKYATPFRFRNNYSYLDNGENSYFCWNHNMLQYDKTLHRYVYICKNKSTHTSSDDGNEYMYIIDPANPLSANPQKIYTENGDQIKWCQGFAIMDDGIWVLADCSVENYDAPQMIISKNNGSTFEILCEFVPPIDSGYFNSISVGFNGRIFGAYDDGTVSISSSNSHIAYSDDSGRTWNDIEITSQKFVEQLILPISETRLALIGRYNAYNSYEQMAVTAYSDDNGLTWTFFNSGMKMHCNDCVGFMHDDLLELFCLERYYKKSFRVGDMTGQLTHYVGSADNFVNNEMIELETFYLTGYDSADLGHPSACMDEYGGAMVITSANHERVQNNTYPLIMWADCNRNPV